MGLVDYGSDSDSDPDSATPSPAPVPTPAPAPARSLSSSSSSSSVPSCAALHLPPPASAAPAPVSTKRSKGGPVRILLDLPPPSASSSSSSTKATSSAQEPAAKRPRIDFDRSSGQSGAPPLTGLAALLPQPKNDYRPTPTRTAPTPVAPPTSLTGGQTGIDGLFAGDDRDDAPRAGTGNGVGGSPGGGPMFLPPSVSAKAKAKAKAPAAPQQAPEPALDFFGIGSVTSAAPATKPSTKASSSTSSSSTRSAAPSISSAPPPKSTRPAFGQPTAADPYPGFTQLPSGEWVAKDQQTYEMWVAWSAAQQQQMAAGGGATRDAPREFDASEIEQQGGLVEVDEAQRAREAWNNRPESVPGQDGKEQYKTSSEIKGIPSQIGGMARRKHQLSSLLAAAHDNRAELEERLAQARANRKGAGSKYGF